MLGPRCKILEMEHSQTPQFLYTTTNRTIFTTITDLTVTKTMINIYFSSIFSQRNCATSLRLGDPRYRLDWVIQAPLLTMTQCKCNMPFVQYWRRCYKVLVFLLTLTLENFLLMRTEWFSSVDEAEVEERCCNPRPDKDRFLGQWALLMHCSIPHAE